MPRIARKDLNTQFLHVMVQGVNKEYIFNNEKNIEEYLKIINKNKILYNFTIIAYCIMNNHAHFLIYTEDIEKFGKGMQKTNLLYAQMYNKEQNRVGVLFRNRYQTEPIYNIKYLINCIKYIHNNPVKAKMVSKCEDYKYSSYNDYIHNNKITKSEIVEKIFGKKCNFEKLFKETYEKRFIDVDDNDNIEKYIINGIREYKKEKKESIAEIFSNRELLKKIISYLYNECGIKYIEIRNYFEISRGTMDKLKTN